MFYRIQHGCIECRVQTGYLKCPLIGRKGTLEIYLPALQRRLIYFAWNFFKSYITLEMGTTHEYYTTKYDATKTVWACYETISKILFCVSSQQIIMPSPLKGCFRCYCSDDGFVKNQIVVDMCNRQYFIDASDMQRSCSTHCCLTHHNNILP